MFKNKALGLRAAWLSPASREEPSPPARNAEDQVATFYESHRRALVGYLTALFGNPEDAEEVAQETYYRMYDLLAGGHTINNARVWAFRVAKNLMLDRVDKRKNDAAKVKGLTSVSPLTDTKTAEARLVEREALLERRDLLRQAFARLTDVERQCVLGRAHGLKLNEMAEIVGLRPKRVSDVIGRAIEKLQRELGG